MLLSKFVLYGTIGFFKNDLTLYIRDEIKLFVINLHDDQTTNF